MEWNFRPAHIIHLNIRLGRGYRYFQLFTVSRSTLSAGTVENRFLVEMAFPSHLITLEEHFLSQSVVDHYAAHSRPDPYQETILLRRYRDGLMEVGDVRLQSMKHNQISLQVLSHAANALALNIGTCTKVNDELAQSIRKQSGSFAGFVTLLMIEPKAASKEFRRGI